jgi:RNA polymerase sigma-70 factor (ECF subfamily)
VRPTGRVRAHGGRSSFFAQDAFDQRVRRAFFLAKSVRELLEQHLTPVYRFALRLTGDVGSAEDLAQETMLRAWRNREKLESAADARPWLFRITVNLWRDGLRRQHVRHSAARDVARGAAPGPAPSERQAEQREAVDAALAALDELPPRQREVLYLSACEGMHIGTIASVLGMQTGAVKSSLSLARQRVRGLLSREPSHASRAES